MTRRPSTFIPVAIALCLVAAPVALAQQGGRTSSSKIVAFSNEDGAAEPATTPAPTPTAVDVARAPLPLLYGRLVPSPPRLDVGHRVTRSTPSKFKFTARPAVASSFSVSSQYGVRVDPFTGNPRMHTLSLIHI